MSMTKRGKALEEKLAGLEERVASMEARGEALKITEQVAGSRVALMNDEVHKLETRVGVARDKLARVVTKLREEELRYHLLERLMSTIVRASNEQYHTSNLPEHAGYIIKDDDMAAIRKLLGELGVE